MSKMFLKLTLFGLLAGVAAHAQSSQPLQANVPFAFTVRQATLPAGSYRLTFARNGYVLRVQGVNNPADNALTLAAPGSDPQGRAGAARLVFHCYGKGCYLAQVWDGGAAGTGLELPHTQQERRLAFQTRIISMTMAK
jgi:hypothetical protein